MAENPIEGYLFAGGCILKGGIGHRLRMLLIHIPSQVPSPQAGQVILNRRVNGNGGRGQLGQELRFTMRHCPLPVGHVNGIIGGLNGKGPGGAALQQVAGTSGGNNGLGGLSGVCGICVSYGIVRRIPIGMGIAPQI